MSEADKPLAWLHGEVKTPRFSKEARVEAGVLLRRLQRGETLSNTTIAWRHNTMNRTKRARLEAKGWRSGSAADFLELTPEEAAFIETKLALTETLRKRRAAQHLTQHSLAKRLSSSQSRIAKMEAGDSSVSVDLLLRALFALGAKPRDIANALQRRRRVAT